jgi:hypothetical protein
MQKTAALFLLLVLCSFPVSGEPRSFNEIFPGIDAEIQEKVFSDTGFIASFNKPNFNLLPAGGLDPQIAGKITGRRPDVLVESLMVIPYGEKPLELVDIYNAIGNIRDLKGRLYHSGTRNQDIPLFEEATRIESPKKTSPVQDPPRKSSVPPSETIYIRLKDTNFGNSYYRGDIRTNEYGFLYSLSNYKNMTYLFIPVIKEDKFISRFYFEPIAEGVLLYGIAGADVSDFIASKIDMPSAIKKRFEVILGWVIDGIKNSG